MSSTTEHSEAMASEFYQGTPSIGTTHLRALAAHQTHRLSWHSKSQMTSLRSRWSSMPQQPAAVQIGLSLEWRHFTRH